MKSTPICLALAALFATGSAHAAGDARLRAQLEKMVAEIESLKAELKTVKAQVAATPPQAPARAVTAAPATPVALAAPTAPVVTSAPAAPAPQALPGLAGGMAGADAYAAAPANPTSFFGYGEINYNRPFRDQSQTQMDVRRIVLGVSHQASERTRIVTEFEFEHGVTSATDSGEASVEQAYVEHRLSDGLGLKGGLFLIPLGRLNLRHEPTTYYGVERNFVETAIIPSTWREVGLSAFGATEAGLSWDVGLTSGFDLNKWNATGTEGRESPLGAIHQEGQLARANNLSVYGALSWRGTPGLDVGAGVFTGQASHKLKDPSTANAGLYAPDARITLWDAHARWTPGRWDLSALYARGSITDTGALNAHLPGTTLVPKSFFGWYTQAAYRLWEHDEYQLSPFTRYEVFNTAASYDAPAGIGSGAARDEKVLTAGANLRVGEHVVLKADVQRFQVERGRDRLDLGIGYQF